MLKKIITLLLATILVFSTSIVSFADDFDESFVESNCWMKYLPDNAPITEINMPGTHDAACRYFIKNDILSNSITTSYAKTQSLSIPEQFNAGVRYMDCRICLKNENDGYLTVPHNMTITADKKDNGEIMKINTIVAYAEEFVKAHPTETVVLMIANDTRTYDDYMEKFAELKQQLIDSFKDSKNENRVFLDTENGIVSPTVGEMRGKVAMILSGDIVGVSHGVDETGEWKWTNTIKPYFDEVVNQNYTNPVIMNKANGTSSRPITVNTSCTGINSHILPAPDSESSVMNKYIMNYGLAKGKFLGWFQSDYVTEELNRKIYLTNNFVFDLEAPATCNHKHVVKINGYEATCTKDGYVENWYCLSCHKHFKTDACTEEMSNYIITAGHDNPLHHEEYHDSTTSATGNQEYWYCSKCNTYFKNDTATEAFEKNEWVIAKKSSGGGGGSGSGGGGGGGSDPGTTTDPTEEDPVVEPEEPDNSELIAAVESSTVKKAKLVIKKKKVKLSWKKIDSDFPVKYVISRSLKKNKAYKKIKTITNEKNSFTDTKKLKKGKRYYYKIVAQIKIDDNWYQTKPSIKSVKLK